MRIEIKNTIKIKYKIAYIASILVSMFTLTISNFDYNAYDPNCVYDPANDPNCNDCLPYDYYKISYNVCSECSTLLSNCIDCYTNGCEVCSSGYQVYLSYTDNILECMDSSYKCDSYFSFVSRTGSSIPICVLKPGKSGINDSLSAGSIILIVLGAILVILSSVWCLHRMFERYRKNKIVQPIQPHSRCSICNKPKEDVNIKGTNKLNCDGFLCSACEIIALECLKTGNYEKCKSCFLSIIWYISNADDKNDENKNENSFVEEGKDDKFDIIGEKKLNNIENFQTIKVEKENDSVEQPICKDKLKDNMLSKLNFNPSDLIGKSKSNDCQLKEIKIDENKKQLGVMSNNYLQSENKNEEKCIEVYIQKDYLDNKITSTGLEKCVVCFKSNPDSVIPCINKPKHKLHKKCLADFFHSGKINPETKLLCPICRSIIV